MTFFLYSIFSANAYVYVIHLLVKLLLKYILIER